MTLTRDFKETVQALVERDGEFRIGLLKEAVDHLLAGDFDTGRLLLRDYINATVGFQVVADQIKTPPKSLHRMLGVKGNPRADNLFRLLALLQNAEHVDLEVQVKPRERAGRLVGVQELRATYEAGVRAIGKRDVLRKAKARERLRSAITEGLSSGEPMPADDRYWKRKRKKLLG